MQMPFEVPAWRKARIQARWESFGSGAGFITGIRVSNRAECKDSEICGGINYCNKILQCTDHRNLGWGSTIKGPQYTVTKRGCRKLNIYFWKRGRQLYHSLLHTKMLTKSSLEIKSFACSSHTKSPFFNFLSGDGFCDVCSLLQGSKPCFEKGFSEFRLIWVWQYVFSCMWAREVFKYREAYCRWNCQEHWVGDIFQF